MTAKRSKKKIVLILSVAFFTICIIVGLRFLYSYHLKLENENAINIFFENTTTTSSVPMENKTENKNTNVDVIYDFIAVLEIPSISLKRGLVAKNSPANTVSKNIQILDESNMPDVENGNFILASHSGNSRVAFFQKLNLVKNDDIVYVYYKGIKYIYKIVDTYLEVKDGTITIQRNAEKSILTLTTCSQEQKGKQIVVIGELIDKEMY